MNINIYYHSFRAALSLTKKTMNNLLWLPSIGKRCERQRSSIKCRKIKIYDKIKVSRYFYSRDGKESFPSNIETWLSFKFLLPKHFTDYVLLNLCHYHNKKKCINSFTSMYYVQWCENNSNLILNLLQNSTFISFYFKKKKLYFLGKNKL